MTPDDATERPELMPCPHGTDECPCPHAVDLLARYEGLVRERTLYAAAYGAIARILNLSDDASRDDVDMAVEGLVRERDQWDEAYQRSTVRRMNAEAQVASLTAERDALAQFRAEVEEGQLCVDDTHAALVRERDAALRFASEWEAKAIERAEKAEAQVATLTEALRGMIQCSAGCESCKQLALAALSEGGGDG